MADRLVPCFRRQVATGAMTNVSAPLKPEPIAGPHLIRTEGDNRGTTSAQRCLGRRESL